MVHIAHVLLFDPQGKLVIYLRDAKPSIPFPHHWDLFGGHVEKGETPEQALLREVQEELHLDLQTLGFQPYKIFQCKAGDAHPNVKHLYWAVLKKPANKLKLQEGERLECVDLRERDKIKFANVLGEIVDEFAHSELWQEINSKHFKNLPEPVKEPLATKHVGIVACSTEGAALCYRHFCKVAAEKMGEHMHPDVSLHTYPLAEYMRYIRSGNWEEVAKLMHTSAVKLHSIGAEIFVCPDNTIHQAFGFIDSIPGTRWLHIAKVVGREALLRGYCRLGILGTKYLMTGPVYSEALKELGIAYTIPGPAERQEIDRIIFKELVNDIITERSRLYFNNVIQKLKVQGCEAVVLGCTEIPLLVDPDDCPLPVLDSTRLLAEAALAEALN